MSSTLALPQVTKRLTYLVVFSQIVMMIWSIASSFLATGPFSIFVLTFALFAMFVGYAWFTKNVLLTKLIYFGLVAGIVELAADHYLVSTVDSLVYPKSELMIWSSPLYMPFAWCNVLIQLGYYSLLLSRWKGTVPASIMIAIAGGMYIPIYEHLAKDAGWWFYKLNTKMFMNAPIYVILCEALISFSLPYLLVYATKKSTNTSIGIGLVGGFWIFAAAVISYIIAA